MWRVHRRGRRGRQERKQSNHGAHGAHEGHGGGGGEKASEGRLTQKDQRGLRRRCIFTKLLSPFHSVSSVSSVVMSAASSPCSLRLCGEPSLRTIAETQSVYNDP